MNTNGLYYCVLTRIAYQGYRSRELNINLLSLLALCYLLLHVTADTALLIRNNLYLL